MKVELGAIIKIIDENISMCKYAEKSYSALGNWEAALRCETEQVCLAMLAHEIKEKYEDNH